MEIKQIKITKKQLQSMPEEDQTLLVLLGHIANELSILHKFLIFSSARDGSSGIESQVRVAHFILIARLYVGKLLESRNLLNKIYFGTKLSLKYDTTLSAEGKKCLDKIKKYFSNKNLISDIRNSYAFHYDVARLKPQLDQFGDNEEFDILIGGPFANNYYLISEEIISKAMLAQIDKDKKKATEMLMDDLLDISNAFMHLIGHINVAVFELHFPSKDFKQSLIDIKEPTVLDTFRIPVFFTRNNKG